jgi:hypothetical protein
VEPTSNRQNSKRIGDDIEAKDQAETQRETVSGTNQLKTVTAAPLTITNRPSAMASDTLQADKPLPVPKPPAPPRKKRKRSIPWDDQIQWNAEERWNEGNR